MLHLIIQNRSGHMFGRDRNSASYRYQIGLRSRATSRPQVLPKTKGLILRCVQEFRIHS